MVTSPTKFSIATNHFNSSSKRSLFLLPFGGIIIYKKDIQVVGFVEIFYFDPLIIAGSGANHDNRPSILPKCSLLLFSLTASTLCTCYFQCSKINC